MITEGRGKTLWYIACSSKTFHPRTLYNPRDKQGTSDEKSPTESLQTSRKNKKTGDKSGYPEEIGRQNASSFLKQNTLKEPPRVDPSIYSVSDTAEKPAQANIQALTSAR